MKGKNKEKSVGIPKEKRSKSDVKKTWKGILQVTAQTSKHYQIYASRTKQLVIANAPSISEAKQGATLLLVEFPLEVLTLSKHKDTGGGTKTARKT